MKVCVEYGISRKIVQIDDELLLEQILREKFKIPNTHNILLQQKELFDGKEIIIDVDEDFLLTENMYLKMHSFQSEDEPVHEPVSGLLADVDDTNTNSDHDCDEGYDNFMFKV